MYLNPLFRKSLNSNIKVDHDCANYRGRSVVTVATTHAHFSYFRVHNRWSILTAESVLTATCIIHVEESDIIKFITFVSFI